MGKPTKEVNKRPRDEDDQAESVNREIGIASTLRRAENEDAESGWTMAGSRNKKRKTVKDAKRSKATRKAEWEAENARKTGSKPALNIASKHKFASSLKVRDLQNLVLYCLADGTAPQWVAVSNHAQVQKAVVLMVPGLERGLFTGDIKLTESLRNETSNGVERDSVETKADEEAAESRQPQNGASRGSGDPDDFLPWVLNEDSLPAPLKPLAEAFTQLFTVRSPGDDKYSRLYSPIQTMLTAPLPKGQDKRPSRQIDPSSWANERTPITEFLASEDELRENRFVLHPALFAGEEASVRANLKQSSKSQESDGWRDMQFKDMSDSEVPASEIEEGSVTAGRTVLAVDCEMVVDESGDYVLARISVVDWGGEVVLDELVKPDQPVIDYVTAFSGISAESLKNVTTSLKDVQERLLELFHSRTILIGHSLDSDLNAMKVTHPCIVDTSLLYPHPVGPPLKSSLKYLAQKYLGRGIQQEDGMKGHDSIEDARACLDLVKMKCEKGPKWGVSDPTGEPIFKRLERAPQRHASAPAGQPRPGKTSAVVLRGSSDRKGPAASHTISCASDAEVVEGVRRTVLGDDDGLEIPSGGVDFTFAKFRDLETLRGFCLDQRLDQPSEEAKDLQLGIQTLTAAVADVVGHIMAIRAILPPCTLFIVYSGVGDPRELMRLREQHRTFKREYAYKKWDDLSVKWTDTEEQALKTACKKARDGIGFVCMT